MQASVPGSRNGQATASLIERVLFIAASYKMYSYHLIGPPLAIKQYLSYMFTGSSSREMRVRLTVYTDYALRVLMYLALKEDRLATIAEIAESYDISRNHLMKVAHQLGVAGYVETVRGRGGGLRLAKPIAAIGLGEVVRYTEPDMAIVSCFEPLDAPCVIRPILCAEARAGRGRATPFSRCSTVIRWAIWSSREAGFPACWVSATATRCSNLRE